MKKLLLIATVLILSACGTTGQINKSQLSEAIPSGKARIIVSRNNSLLYLAATVHVRSNGIKIASLGRSGSIAHTIDKGKNTLAVSTPTAFGQFIMNFEAQQGKTYFFEVSPLKGSLLSGSVWGIAGDAINASISEQSGYFQIDLKNIE